MLRRVAGERIVVWAAAERLEVSGRDEAARYEFLRSAPAHGFTGIEVPLRIHRDRVEQRELARLVAGTTEPSQDAVAEEAVVDPKRTVPDVVDEHVLLIAIDREVEVVRRPDRVAPAAIGVPVRSRHRARARLDR